MKKIRIIAAVLTMLCLTVSVTAADQVAVAEPVVRGGNLPKTEVEMLWSMLEAGVSGSYRVITRSALQQMMTEIELANSSQLLEQAATLKALRNSSLQYFFFTSKMKIANACLPCRLSTKQGSAYRLRASCNAKRSAIDIFIRIHCFNRKEFFENRCIQLKKD